MIGRTEKILRMLAGKEMTSREVFAELNDGWSLKAVRDRLRVLQNEGRIRSTGEGPSRTYTADADEVSRPARVGQNSGFTIEQISEFRKAIGTDSRHRTERIRRLLKLSPMTGADVIMILKENGRLTRTCLHDMVRRELLTRDESGRFVYKDTVAQRSIDRVRSISVAAKRKESAIWSVKGETVEQFLARGGEIDRSPTPSKFERLKESDISPYGGKTGIGYQSPHQPRRFYGV